MAYRRQAMHKQYSSFMCNLSKTLWQTRVAKNVRLATRTAECITTLYLHWFRCLRPLDSGSSPHKRGQAHSKRWAVLFTCMSTRAVHSEVVMSMDSSSCINALRRFFAIRGPAKQLHSDCGTNFIGACNELGFNKVAK